MEEIRDYKVHNIGKVIKVKGISTQVLKDKLALLIACGIIEEVVINPAKVRMGYGITKDGLIAIKENLPVITWAIAHNIKLGVKP